MPPRVMVGCQSGRTPSRHRYGQRFGEEIRWWTAGEWPAAQWFVVGGAVLVVAQRFWAKHTLPTRLRRLRTPVLSNTLLRCCWTVWTETTRRSAVAAVELPAAPAGWRPARVRSARRPTGAAARSVPGGRARRSRRRDGRRRRPGRRRGAPPRSPSATAPARPRPGRSTTRPPSPRHFPGAGGPRHQHGPPGRRRLLALRDLAPRPRSRLTPRLSRSAPH